MPLKNIHSRWDALRETGNTARWYRNLQQGSPITADVYVRTLGLYCERNHTTPEQILADAKSGALRDGLIDFVAMLQGEGKRGSYIVRFKKVLNSWCLFNGVEPKLKDIKIRGANDASTLSSESPPRKEELAKILRLASTRGRAIIALLAFSGLRPESLGNYKGTDAIRLGDVDGLVITPDGIEISKIPALLHVRGSISKKGHKYFTFIPKIFLSENKIHHNFQVMRSSEITVQINGSNFFENPYSQPTRRNSNGRICNQDSGVGGYSASCKEKLAR